MCGSTMTNQKIPQERAILINQTKNWGVVKNADGTKSIKLRLCFEGSINNLMDSIGEAQKVLKRLDPDNEEDLSLHENGNVYFDTWGVIEACRLYTEGRKAWLRGDFETVAELFGVLTE